VAGQYNTLEIDRSSGQNIEHLFERGFGLSKRQCDARLRICVNDLDRCIAAFQVDGNRRELPKFRSHALSPKETASLLRVVDSQHFALGALCTQSGGG
jgi:hypothetical protein